MSENSSEEKSLPASEQKLRKAREKGGVVTARDCLASVVLAVALVYLWLRRDSVSDDLVLLFVLDPPGDLPFEAQLAEKARIALRLSVGLLAPLFALTIAVGVLMGMAITGGPVFSTHPLSPEFDKINPVKGFKNIFGRRALMTFLMHLLRITALFVAMGAMLWAGLGAMVNTPACGLDCALETFQRMTVPILLAALAVLAVFAVLDFMVQRAEFLREQRMTITEMKRENKDMEGDPHLRSQLAQNRRAMVERPTGLSQATVLIVDPLRAIVAIRYIEGDTPAPLVVLRARGGEAVSRVLRAGKLHVAADLELMRHLAKVPVGEYVTDDAAIQLLVPHLQAAISRTSQ